MTAGAYGGVAKQAQKAAIQAGIEGALSKGAVSKAEANRASQSMTKKAKKGFYGN